jgi:Di-haem oxidoreductase, putative peroxidase
VRNLATPLCLCALLLALPAAAQLGERPGTAHDTSAGPKDLTGMSVKTPRVRAVHTTDPALLGGTMYLQQMDPFLAFKMGKDLTQREFRPRDGVFAGGQGISSFKGTLSDGVTPAIVGNDQTSCGGCHNMPYRDAGLGTNFAKKSGLGRNATHFFGSGIQEMIAWQVRQKMMQQLDANRNNWVDRDEMNAERILVSPTPGAPGIDYGASGDLDGDGWPDLNNIFRVWFVDAQGRVVDGAQSLGAPGVAGYNFMMEVFGWGEARFNLNTTNRIFAWDPWAAHGGLEAYDPTTAFDPEHDGFSQVSNAGFQQSWIGHIPPDPGHHVNSVGLSTDDPDGDGSISEITEGDLDLVEWYMLNSPRPAEGRQTDKTRRGEGLLHELGCAECHVSDWLIEAADPANPDLHRRYNGDLRDFDFDVRWNDDTERLQGRLIPLSTIDSQGRHVPNRGAFLVHGIYTDFKHHEMGPRLMDVQYDGVVVSKFRTGLLWGNGESGFPWGHDGASMTIDDVIRRHGGDSRASRNAYVNASDDDQDALVAYLRSLILYPTDLVPADVDGDGVIAPSFMVAGENTGYERFNPEWLFRTPGEIESYTVNPVGHLIHSRALVNVREAYGLDLPYVLDSDLDGFPDLTDECPGTVGYKDGCNN